jgi:hypothetical protein
MLGETVVRHLGDRDLATVFPEFDNSRQIVPVISGMSTVLDPARI